MRGRKHQLYGGGGGGGKAHVCRNTGTGLNNLTCIYSGCDATESQGGGGWGAMALSYSLTI